MAPGHTPVLLHETLEWMTPAPGEIFLDGTTGAGGHAAEIAARVGPRGLLVCADADPSMLEIAASRLSAFPWVRLVHADFADLDALRGAAGGRTFDGVLLDLGISSLQLDDPARGFSFRVEGPLDMRRDPDGGGATAAEILRDTREKDLADLFFQFGEERFSRRIAARWWSAGKGTRSGRPPGSRNWFPRRFPAEPGHGTFTRPRGCSRRCESP